MRASGLEQVARDHLHLQQRNAGLSDYQKIESVVLLMAAGGDCYDTCSDLISYGTCEDDEVCGGGGVSNQCSCVPEVSCASVGADCGSLVDDCGTTLACGARF